MTVPDTDAPFQSTLPAGGATKNKHIGTYDTIISIHAPRGGSDLPMIPPTVTHQISIHAPRGGSDAFPRYFGSC